VSRLAILLVAALGGCSSAPDATAAADAERACQQACQVELGKGVDLSSGPCLSDARVGGAITPDFACDVAHEPRQAVDDEAKNQCQAFRSGKVSHFVEVDPSCQLIRVE
jgi:hypothetical protein